MGVSIPNPALIFVHSESKPAILQLFDHFKKVEENSIILLEQANKTDSILQERLAAGLSTAIDITLLNQSERVELMKLAKAFHVACIVLILSTENEVSIEVQKLSKIYKKEGFKDIYIINNTALDFSSIVVAANMSDLKEERGPFDIIGDVHGCYEELLALLAKLKYTINIVSEDLETSKILVSHPQNRKVIFVGDLVDKGPNTPAVLNLVMQMVQQDIAFCVQGNHEAKLIKKLKGKDVTLRHGLEKSVEQLKTCSTKYIASLITFMYNLPHHLIFDQGKLIIAHAGIKEKMQGRDSGTVRAFTLYGETTGKLDADGLPERKNWSLQYRGQALVVHGHVPIVESKWVNRVLDIDTGCVYGGHLTALRYPSLELVDVPAKEAYATPKSKGNPFVVR